MERLNLMEHLMKCALRIVRPGLRQGTLLRKRWKSLRQVVFLVLVVGLSALWSGLPIRAAAQQQDYVPNQVVVGIATPWDDPNQVAQRLAPFGQLLDYEPRLNTYLLGLRPGLPIPVAKAQISPLPGVEFVQENWIDYADGIPDNPLFPLQYAPLLIAADLAWDLWSPLAPVVIAIVDTGVDSAHPGLTHKIYTDSLGVVGYNAFLHARAVALDDNGHGTHCAGIAAAQINNGIGIAGIAGWNGLPGSDTTFTKIMPVKVLSSAGAGPSMNVAVGIVWAADHGAQVISLSLGSAHASAIEHHAIDYAYAKGCVIVAAAGNDGSPAPHFPAAFGHALSVAATDATDTLTGFSNYGSWVKVAAPGADILSTLPGGGYGYKSGTSMACPHVSGEAALIMAQYPMLSNDAVMAHITANVDPYLPFLDHTISSGGGRINVAFALADESATTGWITKTPMPTDRAWLAAATGPDGLIYVTGGYKKGAYSGVVDTVEAYNPVTDVWTPKMPMHTVRGLHATATGTEGTIYVFGGTSGIPGALLGSVESYSTVTGLWTSEPPMPTPRWGLAAATAPDGKIYVAGGGVDYPSMLYSGAVATVECFDPATHTWTSKSPMLHDRVDFVLLTGPDGLLYALGGMDHLGAMLKTVETYDPATDTWSPAPPLPVGRALLAGAVGADGLLYLVGGLKEGMDPFGPHDVVQTYNTTTGVVTNLPSLHTERFRLAAAVSVAGDLFAFGGVVDYSTSLNTVEKYTPAP